MSIPLRKIRALGSDVDALTLGEAVEIVIDWVRELQSKQPESRRVRQLPSRFVVTPNLDHVVQLKTNKKLVDAYRDAALVLADGMPLVWATKIFRRPLPERVAGSDLAPEVLRRADAGTRVFFLGASEEASQRAVRKVHEKYPQIRVVGRLSPPFGFENSEEWSARIVDEIRKSRASLLIVGLGAPKQEIWIHEHMDRLPGTVALCVGATIDFLAGTVSRAPTWAQKSGLEWVHRLLSNPRRLAGRYARDAYHLPGLLLEDARFKQRDQN